MEFLEEMCRVSHGEFLGIFLREFCVISNCPSFLSDQLTRPIITETYRGINVKLSKTNISINSLSSAATYAKKNIPYVNYNVFTVTIKHGDYLHVSVYV